jgi:hypothetical protein
MNKTLPRVSSMCVQTCCVQKYKPTSQDFCGPLYRMQVINAKHLKQQHVHDCQITFILLSDLYSMCLF